jgi:excinuclease ABC subunit A
MTNNRDIIRIRGARVHNLKNVNIDIPLNKLICFAGPSGSGKTSLAFHTLLNESKRRFVNSFPNSMKFFADRPTAVDVDEIFPVLPVFGLPQINPVMGSRSIVADIMRLTETLQGLFYHYAKEYCPKHKVQVEIVSFSSQLKKCLKIKDSDVWHVLIEKELGLAILGESFIPPRSWDSKNKKISEFSPEDDYWEVFRFKESTLSNLDTRQRDVISLLFGRPLLVWREGIKKAIEFQYESTLQCPQCDYSGMKRVTVSAFSPHSALGACKSCSGYGANLVFDETKMIDRDLSVNEGGLGFLRFGPLDWYFAELKTLMKRKKWSAEIPIKQLPKEFFQILNSGSGDWEGFEEIKKYLNSKRYKPAVRVFLRKMQREELCFNCLGSRLDPAVENFRLRDNLDLNLANFSQMTLLEFKNLSENLAKNQKGHVKDLCDELFHKSSLACSMGLDHLQLNRKTRSLSAGEYQRLLLLKYLSFKGTDSLFVLDEPSLGLGEVEQKMLIKGLREIIAQGNTVIIVDHSKIMQMASDHLVLMGPDSGEAGGKILNEGLPKDLLISKNKSSFEIKRVEQKFLSKNISIKGVEIFNKTWPEIEIPLGQLIWAHGNSGTGKTACLVKTLAHHIYKSIHKENLIDEPGTYRSLKGHQSIKDVIVVDSNLNRFTSRSSVGTITDFAPVVRKHFLKLPVAKAMGLKDGHLSANSELGMCLRCEGRGHLVIEMQYLEDIILPCDDCKGKKIRPVYAEISDGVMTVSEAFSKPLSEVLSRIDLTPKFKRTWEYLKILNLDYLSLDRPLNTLSGGEKQRLYLLSKLLKSIEDTLVIFENLSFGLSDREIYQLGKFLGDLSLRGNTLIVIDSEPLFGKLAQFEIHFTTDNIQTRRLT